MTETDDRQTLGEWRASQFNPACPLSAATGPAGRVHSAEYLPLEARNKGTPVLRGGNYPCTDHDYCVALTRLLGSGQKAYGINPHRLCIAHRSSHISKSFLALPRAHEQQPRHSQPHHLIPGARHRPSPRSSQQPLARVYFYRAHLPFVLSWSRLNAETAPLCAAPFHTTAPPAGL